MTKTKLLQKKKKKATTSMAPVLSEMSSPDAAASATTSLVDNEECPPDEDFFDAESGEDGHDFLIRKASPPPPYDESTSFDVRYRLHKAIFEHQSLETIEEVLRSFEDQTKALAMKDVHGNTPFHLAVMLGQREVIDFLVERNAPTKTRNALGWTVLDEAISYGNRETSKFALQIVLNVKLKVVLFTVKALLRLVRKQNRQSLKERQPAIKAVLQAMPDFQLELRWEFYSWLPIVKRFLPSDTCHIWKRGHQLRLDTTLVDFADRSWQRGNLSILFNGETHGLVMLDNDIKVFQCIRFSSDDATDIEFEVDGLMSADILYPHFSTKGISFGRAQSGWFFNKYDKTVSISFVSLKFCLLIFVYKQEKIGRFVADFYNVNGFVMESRKRREHLSDDDVIKNKALFDVLSKATQSKDKEMSKNGASSSGSTSKGKRKGSSGDGLMPESASMCEHLSKNGTTNKKKETTKLGEDGKKETKVAESNSCSDIVMDTDDDDDGDTGVDDLDQETLAIAGAQRGPGNQRTTTRGYKPKRKSLAPPPRPTVTWAQYITAAPGKQPTLARPLNVKLSYRTFKPTLAMVSLVCFDFGFA